MTIVFTAPARACRSPSIWVMTSLGVGVYLGGNLIWATIISMILAGIGFPIVWGVLGGSMPRSGGEYIYNSRIIHPIVGIGESFGNAFVYPRLSLYSKINNV